MKLLPIDQLNLLKLNLQSQLIQGKLNSKDCIDAVLELLIIAYVNGIDDAGESLNITLTPDVATMQSVIYRKIDGKDFTQRVADYAAQGDLSGIMLVADTESHRTYNEGIFKQTQGIAKSKTWHTMKDDRVRDTHSYLEGVTIPMDAEFYTFNGDKAYAPGQFGVGEEDCNCRCYMTVGR